MANKPEEFKTWSDFSNIELKSFQKQFYDYYSTILPLLNIPEASITFDRNVVTEIIIRVKKRRVYFWIFHGIEMNEMNETAIFCYWLVKLKPFYRNDDQHINEKIALFIFFHAVKKMKNKLISRRIIEILAYDFRYREISKEALMTFGETLIF
jgi:hypothetical protein